MALAHEVSRVGSHASNAGSPAAATAANDALPSFSVDDAGLQSALAAVPKDQPGAPAMRWVKLINSQDGRLTCGVWDCEAGVFDVAFKCDEVVHILEGEVIVTTHGSVQTLRPGDVAFFACGLATRWEVLRYVRKLWLHHFPKPTLRERVEYKLRMLLGTLPES